MQWLSVQQQLLYMLVIFLKNKNYKMTSTDKDALEQIQDKMNTFLTPGATWYSKGDERATARKLAALINYDPSVLDTKKFDLIRIVLMLAETAAAADGLDGIFGSIKSIVVDSLNLNKELENKFRIIQKNTDVITNRINNISIRLGDKPLPKKEISPKN